MPLSPFQIQHLIHTLDPNIQPVDIPAACVVLDITINNIYCPHRLNIRHKCGYTIAQQYVTELINHHMLTSDWIADTDIETTVLFFLRVMVAQGEVTTQPTHVPKPYTFGPLIREARYITL